VLGEGPRPRLRHRRPHRNAITHSRTVVVAAGLVGSVFREMSERLVGVDASPEMLRVAAETEMYDQLCPGDILTELPRVVAEEFGPGALCSREPRHSVAHPSSVQPSLPAALCDLVLAADVLCYFGHLEVNYKRQQNNEQVTPPDNYSNPSF
jgi:predicted TPR repeat methyltransferase